MKEEKLEEILKNHRDWVTGNGGCLADLSDAYLSDANLSGADLRCANLRCADLLDADLRCADLRCADLRCADLRRANLSGANLSDANLSNADLPNFQICPEVGSFQAFKKTTKGIIRIEIPEDAKRTSSLVGRKCRAEYVKVIDGDGVGGKSLNYGSLTYENGAIVKADKYDDDIRVECTHGVHFFMTKKEAMEWQK